MADETATAADWRGALKRGGVSTFELACLLHGKAPRLVFNAVADELRARDGRIGAEYAHAMAGATAGRLAAMPEAMLGDAIGGTLRTLLQVSLLPINGVLPLEDARQLVGDLGLTWPDDLTLPSSVLGAADESPVDRRARRLARFLALGGELRPAGNARHVAGQRGALAALAREERARGSPRNDPRDVKRDLEAAMREQVGS